MTHTDRRQSTLLVFGVLLLGTTTVRSDEAKQIDRTPKSCIMVNSIERDEAASDRTVLFFMRGKNKVIYRNDMPAACAFLKRGETELEYHYNTQSVKLTRLCDYDGITVEHTNQITCALGKFTQVTVDEAAALLGRPVGGSDATASQPPTKNAGAASSGNGAAEQEKKK
jgi:hypothetical protein